MLDFQAPLFGYCGVAEGGQINEVRKMPTHDFTSGIAELLNLSSFVICFLVGKSADSKLQSPGTPSKVVLAAWSNHIYRIYSDSEYNRGWCKTCGEVEFGIQNEFVCGIETSEWEMQEVVQLNVEEDTVLCGN